MLLKLIAADKTDVGKQREQNEDTAYKRIESFEDGDRGLFIVADGMGGYQAGEVASKIAVETISKGLESFFQPVEDQTTIKLTPQMTELANDTASPQNGDVGKQAVKTRKLAETPIAKSVEEQFISAIQQA